MWGKESKRVSRMKEDEGMGIRTIDYSGRELNEWFKEKLKCFREESDDGTGTVRRRY